MYPVVIHMSLRCHLFPAITSMPTQNAEHDQHISMLMLVGSPNTAASMAVI